MTQLPTILSELLFEHDLVIVPGLGAFARHSNGAKVNVITNQFERPSSSIRFLPQQREEDDLLANAVATHEGCPLEEAKALVAAFVADCYAELGEGHDVALPGLGTLTMDASRNLGFMPDEHANFNGDAFGLGDFDMTPVYDGKASEDWRAQVVKQNKDKNTPMTVDLHAMDDDDGSVRRRRRRRTVLITLLCLLVLVPAALLLLHRYEVIHLDFLEKPKPIQPLVSVPMPDSTLQSQLVCYHIPPQPIDEPEDTVQSVQPIEPIEEPEVEPIEEPKVEPIEEPEVEPIREGKIFIIGGCYSQEENAEKQASSIREEGFEDAFVMKRGKMYYVCYGRFVTMEDANVELARIRVYSNNKAWILNK